MDSDNDDLDDDIERLKIILQDGESDEGEASDGELRNLEDEESYADVDHSRPTTSSDVTASSFPTTSMGTEGDESILRFDPSTISPETCLEMNQTYQEFLLNTLRQIEIALSENRAKQKALNNELENKGKSMDKCIMPKAKRIVFYKPYFKDSEGHIPPPNEDVITKQKMNESKQYVRPKTGWTRHQRQMLLKAVQSDGYQQLLRPVLNKLNLEIERANECSTEQEIAESQANVERLSNEIEQIKKMPVDELLQKIDYSKIDYLKISVNTFPKFDPLECQYMWMNALQPGINKTRWTETEETRLVELVEQHGMRNWRLIADQLGTKRTPYQCLQHYQVNNFDYEQGDWTEAEDELLKEVVETCKYGVGTIPWQQVAYYIDRRSAYMCRQRYEKIDSSFSRGKWSEAEDMMLLASVQMLGGLEDWQIIQQFVPGRSAQQCRERYHNCLNSAINFDPFSYAEDRQILRKYNEIGGEWLTISGMLKGRTDTMVRRRYDKLMQWKSLHDTLMEQPVCVRDRILHPAFTVDANGMYWLKNLRVSDPGMKSSNAVKVELNDNIVNEGHQEPDKQQETTNLDTNDTALEVQRSDNDVEPTPHNETGVKQEFLFGLRFTAKEMWNCIGSEDLKQDLEVFLKKSAVQLTDYYQQHEDLHKGDIVVPRPPPLNKYSLAHFKHQIYKMNHLHKAVKIQIEKDVKFLQDYATQNPDTSSSLQFLALLQQKDAEEADVLETVCNYLSENFGGKLPGKFTVKKLITAARQNHGKKKKKRKKPDSEEEDEKEMTDDEESDEDSTFYWSDNDEGDTVKKDEVGSSSDEEYFANLRELAEKNIHTVRGPRSQKVIASFRKDMKLHSELNRLITSILKMQLKRRQSGRRRRFNMFPASSAQVSSCAIVKEKDTMDKKTVLLLMKSLDVDAKAVCLKAYRRQKHIAMLAKETASDTLKRTRAQTCKIPQQLGFLKAEAQEAEAVLELRSDLKMTSIDLEVGQGDTNDLEHEELRPGTSRQEHDSASAVGIEHKFDAYDKLLPYQPPNRYNLRGMKNLLYQHKILIDNAGEYFNPDALRDKLYEMKKRGPNPMMNVLMSIAKGAETVRHVTGIRRDVPASALKLSILQLRQLKQETMDGLKKTGDFLKLKARFLSVFLWPALVSTVVPPKNRLLPQSLLEKLQLQKQEKADPTQTASTDQKQTATAANSTKISTEDKGTQLTAEDGEVSRNADDVSTNIDNVIINSGSTKLDKDMPEEEAIEKLVSKIRDEYAANKRKKNNARFGQYKKKPSEKMEQAKEKRMRLLILRRLGLEQRMKELQKKRLEEEGSKQIADCDAVETTSNKSTAQKNRITKKIGKENTSAENVRKRKSEDIEPKRNPDDDNVNDLKSPLIIKTEPIDGPETVELSTELVKGNTACVKFDTASTSEMLKNDTTEFAPDAADDHTVENNNDEEVVASPKRKRGRKPGSKLVYDKEPTRKSKRGSFPKIAYSQETRRPPTNFCKKLRRLLPDKMGHLVAKIPDIPILSEPMPKPASKKMSPTKSVDSNFTQPRKKIHSDAKKLSKEAKILGLKHISEFRQKQLKEKKERIKMLAKRRGIKTASLKTLKRKQLKSKGSTNKKKDAGGLLKLAKSVKSSVLKAQILDNVNKNKSVSKDCTSELSNWKKIQSLDQPTDASHQVCEATKEKMKAKLASKALNVSGNNFQPAASSPVVSKPVKSSCLVTVSQTNKSKSSVANILSLATPPEQIVLIPSGVSNLDGSVPFVSLQRCDLGVINARKRSNADGDKAHGEPVSKSIKDNDDKNGSSIIALVEGHKLIGKVNSPVLQQAPLKNLSIATVPKSALCVTSASTLPTSTMARVTTILQAASQPTNPLHVNKRVREIRPAPSKSLSVQTVSTPAIGASSRKSSSKKKASISINRLTSPSVSKSPKPSCVQTSPNSHAGTFSPSAISMTKVSSFQIMENSGFDSASSKPSSMQTSPNSCIVTLSTVAINSPKLSYMQTISSSASSKSPCVQTIPNSSVGTLSVTATSSTKASLKKKLLKSCVVSSCSNSSDLPTTGASVLQTTAQSSTSLKTAVHASIGNTVQDDLASPKSLKMPTSCSNVGSINSETVASTANSSNISIIIAESLVPSSLQTTANSSNISTAESLVPSSIQTTAYSSNTSTAESLVPSSLQTTANSSMVLASSNPSCAQSLPISSDGVARSDGIAQSDGMASSAASTSGLNLQNLFSSMMGSLQQLMRGANSPSQGYTGSPGSQQPSLGPLIMPVPVTVAGTQQIAFMPVYPNSEGKYVLPDGTVVESGAQGQPVASLPQ
ncbi:uncharacterized protein LOC127837642 isoform X2 [Dreissena polymorpha]|uniref:uncharacterized protein LOC127837642 isoform X2 n=1 Tax=Dreissena polymorpha TaxID=45954 RepID=UPI0022642455|nr:uncharacterized protein LOC127837642 isoform X2 [Dreissena polymorpha]